LSTQPRRQPLLDSAAETPLETHPVMATMISQTRVNHKALCKFDIYKCLITLRPIGFAPVTDRVALRSEFELLRIFADRSFRMAFVMFECERSPALRATFQ